MTIKRSDKILCTKEELMAFLGCDSKEHFATLLKYGLPVLVIGRYCYGHTENIESFIKHITLQGRRKIEEELKKHTKK